MNWLRKRLPKWLSPQTPHPNQLGGALVPADYGKDLQNPDALINRANKRAIKGDLSGAIADFDAAIDLNPAKATAFYNRGYLQNLAGNFKLAIEDCNQAIALLPQYDEAFYQRGLAQYELGDLNGALVDLGEAIRLNPFSIKAYYKRADCYAKLKNIQGAVADYTQAILHVPKDSNAYLRRGIFLTELEEYSTAIDDFTVAVSFNAKNADAYYQRGVCYAALGDQGKANQDFNQAMLYNPNQHTDASHRNYALGILKGKNQLPPATFTNSPESSPSVEPETQQTELPAIAMQVTPQPPLVAQALILDPSPETPLVISNISDQDVPDSTLTLSSETASDLEWLSKTSEALPPLNLSENEVDILFEQAQALAQNGDLDGAIRTYSTIINLEPENTQAYYQRSKALNSIGNTRSASSDLEEAIHWTQVKSLDLMKGYSNVLSETISSLKQSLNVGVDKPITPPSNSIETSILKYSRIIHRNPEDVSAYFERGKSRALLGDLEGAIDDYSHTIQMNPHHRDAYYKRGLLLGALGDEEGATRDMNFAIRHNPALPPVQVETLSSRLEKEATREVQNTVPEASEVLETMDFPVQIPPPLPSRPELNLPTPKHLTVSEARQWTELNNLKLIDKVRFDRLAQEELAQEELAQEELAQEELTQEVTDTNLQGQIDLDALEPDVAKPNVAESNAAEALELKPFELESEDFLEAALPQELFENIADAEIEKSELPKLVEDHLVANLGDAIPSRLSEVVMEPCNHAGTQPGDRYCIRCGKFLVKDP